MKARPETAACLHDPSADEIPRSQPFTVQRNYDQTVHEVIGEVRSMVAEWIKMQGDINQWPEIIIREIRDAQRQGNYEQVKENWCSHARLGRLFIDDILSLMTISWPTDEEVLRDVFKDAFKLFEILKGGIAVIETCLLLVDKHGT